MERANDKSGRDCDFISRLPDSILHHILGSLKAKEAVQTCLLSKRWEHLWMFLPSLSLNPDSFYCWQLFGEIVDDIKEEWLESYKEFVCSVYARDNFWSERFVQFVNMVLLKRKSLDLDMLSINGFLSDEEHIRDWIHYAVKHKTRVLKLDYCLPCCFSPYTFLEELHLYPCWNRESESGILTLPKLKKLIISQGSLESVHLKNLLSGSPILEYLRLDKCIRRDCVIAHGCLKHLAIVHKNPSYQRKLLISAPNLLSFFYDGELLLSCETTLNMSSLTFACLVSRDSSTTKCLAGMTALLSFLANVQLLELHVKCNWQKELPAVLRQKLPIFQKLKNVTVGFGGSSCFQMVTWILKNSPNLKKLTLLEQEREEYLFHDERGASTSESTDASSRVAISSCKNLEIIEVKNEIPDQMIKRSIYALIDGTKANWYTYLSRYRMQYFVFGRNFTRSFFSKNLKI